MAKKGTCIILRILGAASAFSGIMGLYFSYTFNTKDIELTVLSIILNVFGVAIYTWGIYLTGSKGTPLYRGVVVHRLIIFIGMLSISVLYFHFFRYPGDIILMGFGIATLATQLALIKSYLWVFRNKKSLKIQIICLNVVAMSLILGVILRNILIYH